MVKRAYVELRERVEDLKRLAFWTIRAEAAAEALSDINPDTRVYPFMANVITQVGLGMFRDVDVVMTLTTPNCPVADSMPNSVEEAIRGIDEIDDAIVELTWDPPWDPDQMTDEVRLELGLL